MRFTEHDLDTLGAREFEPRDRSRHNIYLVGAYCCTIALVLAFNSGDALHAPIAIIVSIILFMLCLLTLYFRQRNNDLVLATEFQNLLYANAAEQGSLFYIIAKHDGSTAHASGTLKELFLQFNYPITQALDGFFLESRLPKFDQDKILTALSTGATQSFAMKIATYSGTSDVVISTEPLSRPAGYSVIRCRYFSSARGNADALATIPNEAFKTLLQTSPIAHFVCDAYGKVIYANNQFATLMGTHAERLCDGSVFIKSFIQRQNGQALGEEFDVSPTEETITLMPSHAGERQMHLSLDAHHTAKTTFLLATLFDI